AASLGCSTGLQPSNRALHAKPNIRRFIGAMLSHPTQRFVRPCFSQEAGERLRLRGVRLTLQQTGGPLQE
ncbi:MAG: hypothetical protein C4340_07135, partial [Armatimonadota bacterium]